MTRPSLLALSTLAVAAIAIPALAIAKPKPVAYGYGQCTSKTKCSYTAYTNPRGTSITFSASKVCPSAQTVVQQLGPMRVKGGKFSKTARGSASDPKTQQFVPVKIKVKGTLRARKTVKGTLTVTTTASDCAAITGKAKRFNMKYTGPIYGG